MTKSKQGSVRIVAGKWRRTRLAVLDCETLRPTPDRVRETLFNWLAPDLPGARCLDLFAGTGALGFEAASRGAAEVVMVEQNTAALAALRSNCERLAATQIQVVAADAPSWLASSRDAFDIVFLDPPFGRYDLLDLCRWLQQHDRLSPRARVYLESSAGQSETPIPAGWTRLRSGRAARVRYDLVTPDS